MKVLNFSGSTIIFFVATMLGAGSENHAFAKDPSCKAFSLPRQFTLLRHHDVDPQVSDGFKVMLDDFDMGYVAVRKTARNLELSLKDEDQNRLATAIGTYTKDSLVIDVFDCPGNKIGSVTTNPMPGKGLSSTKKLGFTILNKKGLAVANSGDINSLSLKRSGGVNFKLNKNTLKIDSRLLLILAAYELSQKTRF